MDNLSSQPTAVKPTASTENSEVVKLQEKIKNLESQLKLQNESNEALKKQIEELSKTSKESNLPTITTDIKITPESIKTLEKGQNLKQDDEGSTYEAIRKDLLVLKEMNKINEKQIPTFIQENEQLNHANHPNIIKTLGFLLNDKKTPPTIILQRCLSNLNQAIETKKFSKVDASFAIFQIAEGMRFIHSNQIIHSNLKPSNILIGNDGFIKISDVGSNRLRTLNNQSIPLNSDIGSLYFIAPELLNNKQCNEKIDVYSFGVVTFYILTNGQLPNASLIDLVQGKPIQVPQSFKPNAKEIIEFCCSPDPDTRPSFEEIVGYLTNEQCILMDISKSELAEVQKKIKDHQKLVSSC